MSRPAAMRSRFITAYATTFVVLGSYLFWRLIGKLVPRRRYEAGLMALHKRNARRVERAILKLQGMFIKVGQLISIMTNFLPESFRAGLEGLQDQVPARPYRDIAKRLREEFGKDPEELFAHIEHEPISSASIGQVHVARLRSGKKVAVKVQYPEIERMVKLDLRTFKRIFRIVEAFIGHYNLDMVHGEITDMLHQELDFVREGQNIERIAKNLEDDSSLRCPKVEWELTSSRVLTTEFIDAVKISNIQRLDELGIERRPLAERVVEAYCKQIFQDGVYHADPHPGNLLVEPNPSDEEGAKPTIVFLDFGATAELSDSMRRGIIDFLQGVFINDVDKIIAAMRSMGFISRADNPEIFEKVVRYFHESLVEQFPIDSMSLGDIKIDPQRGLQNLADLRRMDISIRDLTNAFDVPKEYIFLERTVLLLLGVCTHLDPQMNPMTIIRPYLQEFILGKEQDWSQFLVKTLREGVMTFLTLPGDSKRLITRSLRGDLELRFKGMDEPAELLYALGHQIIYAMFTVAGGVGALVFYQQGRFDLAPWCGGGGALFALALFVSMWRNRQRARRRGRTR